jgi:photosystem II stability/assembly factor-like uncharacterized protein
MKALLFVVIALVASSFTLCNAQPRNWSHIDGAWGTGTPKAFAAAPNGHLFAMVIDSRNQGKLFRSIDHGAKWQQIYEFPNDEYLQTLTLSALKRGEVIYTCVDTTSYMRKMFISTDDGESWTFSFQTPFTTGWGGDGICESASGKIKLLLPSGTCTSSNRGKTWDTISAIVPTRAVPWGDSLVYFNYDRFTVVAPDGTASQIPYASPQLRYGVLVPISDSSIGLYTEIPVYPDLILSFSSSKDLHTWTKSDILTVPPPGNNPIITITPTGQIMLSPPSLYLDRQDTIISSTDHGQTWRTLATKLQFLGFDAQNAMYFQSTYSIMRSADGSTISPAGFIPRPTVAAIGASSGLLFMTPKAGGGLDGLIDYSSDQGVSWKSCTFADTLTRIAWGDHFCSYSIAGQPALISELHTGVNPYTRFRPYLFNPNNGSWSAGSYGPSVGSFGLFETDQRGNLYLGADFVSNDGGVTWIETGYPDKFPGTGFASTSDGFIFESSKQPVVYRSSDAGQTWTRLPLKIPGVTVVKLAAGAGSIIASTEEGVLIRSDDNGNSWYTWVHGLTDTASVLAMTQSGEVFIGGYAGLRVCRLSDSAMSDVYLGVQSPSITGLAVDANGVFVQTAFDGLYYSGGIGTYSGGPNAFTNYPNPFHAGTTTVSFTLRLAGDASLRIYNEIGQTVETIVNQHLERGAHSYTFQTAALSSHVYFAILQTSLGRSFLKMFGGR